jgi:hypothetical protein
MKQMPCLHMQQGEFLRALIRADITIVEGGMNFPSANPERGNSVMKGIQMTQTENNQTWFTLTEAKTYTRLSESLLRQAIAKGRLKTTRSSENGGKLIFHRTWLDEMLMREISND